MTESGVLRLLLAGEHDDESIRPNPNTRYHLAS